VLNNVTAYRGFPVASLTPKQFYGGVMLEPTWESIKPDLAQVNNNFERVLELRKQIQDILADSEARIESAIASLDAVIAQCSGKKTGFTPIIKDELLSGFQVTYEMGGVSVSTMLLVEKPYRNEDGQGYLTESHVS